MLWRRRSREPANILKLARVNDRIRLEIGEDSYLSRVEDIRPEEIHVAAPVEQGLVKTVAPGQEVIVDLFAGAGLRRFAGVAREVVTRGVPVLVVANFRDLGIIQRREYVRIRQKLFVRYRAESGRDSLGPWCDAVTSDVSGGGIQLVTTQTDRIAVGDFIEVELFLPDEKPVRAVARVLRVSGSRGRVASSVSLGVQFVQIHPAEQSRIVRYVFKKESEMLDAHREFVPCRQRATIAYERGEGEVCERKGYVREMSMGGVRMAVPDADDLSVGDSLEISIGLGGSGTVKARCEVISLRAGEKGSAREYQIGLKFVKLRPRGPGCDCQVPLECRGRWHIG